MRDLKDAALPKSPPQGGQRLTKAPCPDVSTEESHAFSHWFSLLQNPGTSVNVISSIRFLRLGSPTPILHEGMFQFGQKSCTTGWNIFCAEHSTSLCISLCLFFSPNPFPILASVFIYLSIFFFSHQSITATLWKTLSPYAMVSSMGTGPNLSGLQTHS